MAATKTSLSKPRPGPFPFSLSPLYTDLYQLTMAQGYFLTRRHLQPAVFDLYYRSNPFKGGYLIFAGIHEALRILSRFRFKADDLAYLEKQGFRRDFLRYLRKFRFRLNIHAVREGEVVFSREPLVRVEGGLLECQLAETLLINFIHFPSLVATKASRIVQSAKGRSVVDFGLRRAQGPAGLMASRAAFVGGTDGTSNVLCGKLYEIPVFGTQAHSWIQAFGNEKRAFLEFARIQRNNAVLLIDTYHTLKSGLPNLLEVLKALKKEGICIRGVRIDSGDLAYLSKRVRVALDRAGFAQVKIIASGQLDEYIIESLLSQGAAIDAFGVGTKLITSYDEPALDMVYKLSRIGGKPEMKISDSTEKMNEPGKKKIVRYHGAGGKFFLDGILLDEEKKVRDILHPLDPIRGTTVSGLEAEELLRPVMVRGQLARDSANVKDIRDYACRRLSRLPDEHKRFYYPHIYRVGVSRKLLHLRERLIAKRLGRKLKIMTA